jgi:tetratricopeptide (TPR) repeat protein
MMSEQNAFIKILKWIVFLPASLIGGYIAYFLVSMLNKLTMFGFNPDSFMGRLFIEAVSNLAMGAATVFIAAWIVPSYKKHVSIGVCGLLILISGVLLLPALTMPNYWAIYAMIFLIIGAGTITYSVFTGETDVGQIETDYEPSDDWEEALHASDKVLEPDTDDFHRLKNKGSKLYNLDRYEEAVQAYDKALEINPNDSVVWKRKGFVLNDLGRYEEAVQANDKALEINPDDSDVWLNKGFALERLGRYEEALQAYDKALEINPDDDLAWEFKGDVLYELGNYEEAQIAFKKSTQTK